MSNVIDIVVVGLGPAGASAAAAAARAGHTVVAFDRRRAPGRPVQCAELVPMMIGADVRNVSRDVRQRIDAMLTFVEDGQPDLTDPFPGYMLDRAAFDAHLVDDARAAGAVCEFGLRVREIACDGAVRLSDGRVLRSRVLIGADGPRSVVGRAIGSVNTALVETRQITVPLLRAHAATDIHLSTSIPGGYAWMFPKGEVAHVGAGVDEQGRHRLKEIVAGLHATLMANGQVGEIILALTGGAIPVGGMLRSAGIAGDVPVLLAGDAAGLANPVTGAGIVAAVRSGRMAADAAAAWLAGDRNAGDDYQEELDATFGVALKRALHRRREQAASLAAADVTCDAALRRGWIAYPEYWAPVTASAQPTRGCPS